MALPWEPLLRHALRLSFSLHRVRVVVLVISVLSLWKTVARITISSCATVLQSPPAMAPPSWTSSPASHRFDVRAPFDREHVVAIK
jgi:hypothetical protein